MRRPILALTIVVVAAIVAAGVFSFWTSGLLSAAVSSREHQDTWLQHVRTAVGSGPARAGHLHARGRGRSHRRADSRRIALRAGRCDFRGILGRDAGACRKCDRSGYLLRAGPPDRRAAGRRPGTVAAIRALPRPAGGSRTRVVLLLRANPLTSSDLVSYAAGVAGVPPWKVAAGTLIGLAPLCYLQAVLRRAGLHVHPRLAAGCRRHRAAPDRVRDCEPSAKRRLRKRRSRRRRERRERAVARRNGETETTEQRGFGTGFLRQRRARRGANQHPGCGKKLVPNFLVPLSPFLRSSVLPPVPSVPSVSSISVSSISGRGAKRRQHGFDPGRSPARATAAARASRRGARDPRRRRSPGPSVASSNSTPPGSMEVDRLEPEAIDHRRRPAMPAASTCARTAELMRLVVHAPRQVMDGCRRPTRRGGRRAASRTSTTPGRRPSKP